MEVKTLLFETKCPQNTEPTLEIALARARALGIRQVVVASSHGATARLAYARMAGAGIRVIAVSIARGWQQEGWCMSPSERAALTELGIPVITGIHALGDGVGSAFSAKNGGQTAEEIVRETLYRFSQGMKVAVECVLMAADAGLLDLTQEAIAIAGTSGGADTAIVCWPACPRHFHQFEIREVLAKPRVP